MLKGYDYGNNVKGCLKKIGDQITRDLSRLKENSDHKKFMLMKANKMNIENAQDNLSKLGIKVIMPIFKLGWVLIDVHTINSKSLEGALEFIVGAIGVLAFHIKIIDVIGGAAAYYGFGKDILEGILKKDEYLSYDMIVHVYANSDRLNHYKLIVDIYKVLFRNSEHETKTYIKTEIFEY